MRKLLIGPVKDTPSWRWCAADLFGGLRSHFVVSTFVQFEECQFRPHDILLFIKQPPDLKVKIPAASKLAYMPIDYFESPEHVASLGPFLSRCSTILLHSARLMPALRRYCGDLVLVEHYGKYILPKLKGFVSGGFVVWIGFVEYAPLIVDWYLKNPRPFALHMVTNCPNHAPEHEARGLVQHRWDESVQRRLLEAAKAGIDLKGDGFSQLMKPPTKAQHFVASGIPVAVNHGSYAWEYFHGMGFDLATPDDLERWFSHEYWLETLEAGMSLREKISINSVVGAYVDCLSRL